MGLAMCVRLCISGTVRVRVRVCMYACVPVRVRVSCYVVCVVARVRMKARAPFRASHTRACARACVGLPACTLVRATVRVLFIVGCVGVRASMPVCVRVCVRLSACVGGCVHAREPALLCTNAHAERACGFDWLALLFPWQARARKVAAEVKAHPLRVARRALARAPTARAATARAHVARAFLRARVHCWAALFAESRHASDAPICFKIWDYFITFDFLYFRLFSGIYSSVVLNRRHSLPRRALHRRRTRRRRSKYSPPFPYERLRRLQNILPRAGAVTRPCRS